MREFSAERREIRKTHEHRARGDPVSPFRFSAPTYPVSMQNSNARNIPIYRYISCTEEFSPLSFFISRERGCDQCASIDYCRAQAVLLVAPFP